MRTHDPSVATLTILTVLASAVPEIANAQAYTLHCEVENTLNIFANVRTGGNDDSQKIKRVSQEYRIDPAARTITVKYREKNDVMIVDEHSADLISIGADLLVFCERDEDDPECGEAAFKRTPKGTAYGTGMASPVVINLADGSLRSSAMWNMTIWPSSSVVASWFITNNVYKGVCKRAGT